jgi:hypothetical protein
MCPDFDGLEGMGVVDNKLVVCTSSGYIFAIGRGGDSEDAVSVTLVVFIL